MVCCRCSLDYTSIHWFKKIIDSGMGISQPERSPNGYGSTWFTPILGCINCITLYKQLPFLWVLWWPTFGAIPISCKCCSSDLPSPIGDIIFCSKLHLKENNWRIYWISIRVSKNLNRKEKTKKTHWFHPAIPMWVQHYAGAPFGASRAARFVCSPSRRCRCCCASGPPASAKRTSRALEITQNFWTAAFWNHHK